MIHVIATIQTAPGQRAAVLAEFTRLVPLVRAEDGCVEYGPAVDVASGLAAQPVVRPDVITVVEKWSSLAHLKAHLLAPHMADYRQRVTGLVVGVTLKVLEPA